MTFPYDTARLDQLIADVDARIAAADRTVAEIQAFQPRPSGLTEQDLAAIERHAASAGAPKELRELVGRVQAGDLSWNDISSGRALDDPGVQAAMATGLTDLRGAHDAIVEGHTPEEIIGSASGDPDEGGPAFRREDAW